ncbi:MULTISPECIES: leucyl aminopeptidase [unclassified Cryobacterium]|uniref:leucyl aminopeptidase n=1 Tax=unclassified Cryobacterium TaxID=2649013 RepID=UPI002AB4E802|nr:MULTISPECIES: leucyl aminopeptidase [unclassified Cryobacterium]MDY7543852.1 leucyl aminopeptidase [Cryobacterium sp. 5B3]MEA9998531.1 leucyl aminopeptidase [Cryobacterium sp. RTS3]MEB0264439.1 leucyl aminopeptidase [Cryobacterium sp. 10I5]MEB0273564.1 leucyl aminopeptidase [Cryobacterium sp. 5B3]
MTFGTYKLIPESFSPTPSQAPGSTVGILVVSEIPVGLDAVGFLVGPDGVLPAALGVERATLDSAGFTGSTGQTLLLPQPAGPVFFVVGAGPAEGRDVDLLREVAATFARAASRYARIALTIGDTFPLAGSTIGQVVVEGVLLARYRYVELQQSSDHRPLVTLDIILDVANAGSGVADQVRAGVRIGEITARATNLARDLANTPPSHLTATDLGTVAIALGVEHGLTVEVFDKQQIIELGCGGLLGVNAGSVEEPRIIKVTYSPPPTETAAAPAHLALVGKGIMYDSGGISLKPSDPMHLLMKMDMAGAAAVLAMMTALRALDCASSVTAFLMCTDNMPGGSAMKLGDVLTIRGGTTVEIKNTDAEGRLVMSDALVLAGEENPDGIVDVATLTGAALMALGTHTAAVFGNNQVLVDRAIAASRATAESIWQLPLEHRYRPQLKSDVADLSNMGGKYAGATAAALFLAEFVKDVPWAHLDIAGTMQSETDELWNPKGATGFGTRLLIDLALNFAVDGNAATNGNAAANGKQGR